MQAATISNERTHGATTLSELPTLTWLGNSMLVQLDLGVDLVEVGISGVFPARDSDGDEALLGEVVPQDMSRVGETLGERKESDVDHHSTGLTHKSPLHSTSLTHKSQLHSTELVSLWA